MSKIADLNRLRKLAGVKLLTPTEVRLLQEQEEHTDTIIIDPITEMMNEKRKMFKIAGITITEGKLRELCEVNALCKKCQCDPCTCSEENEETAKSGCGCDKCKECDGCNCTEKDCKGCKKNKCTMCSCSEENEEHEEKTCDKCNCDPCTCDEENCEMTK